MPVTGGRTILEMNSRGQSVRINCAIERGGKTGHISRRVGYHHRWPHGAQCRKSPVRAVPGAGTVHGHNPEMVGGAGTYAADVGTYILVRVASLTLERSGEPVAGRRAILEINSRGQSVRINCAIERG